MTTTELTVTTMPALPLRGLVIFPTMLLHFDVARSQSVKALDEALSSGSPIFLVAQKDLSVEEPREGDLVRVGTVCHVRQLLRLPGGVRVLVEGVRRGRLVSLTQRTPYMTAEVSDLPEPAAVRNTPRTEALVRETYGAFERYMELASGTVPETLLAVLASDDPGYIADYIAQNTAARPEDKQSILEELRPVRRLEKMCRILHREVEILQLGNDVESKVREAIDQSQRDYFLREQLKVLQDELGEGEDEEIADYRVRIQQAKLPREVEERLLKELGRLEKQPYGSAEATVSRNYLDVCLELPWGKFTKEKADVAAVRRRLDRDHYGLQKVKERILEYVAVRQLAPDQKGQVLCLVGPPGVGKTSIATSVAKALGRKMARVSLGGVHDEAEIRGHRKTYVGAMPGRIITGIRQAGSANPVLVLDEIDKLGTDGRSDPASALLEVLDAEQNGTFRDNFLEMPYDLSRVMFITTANTLDTVPRPLLDRMEVIELPSYTDEEKLGIAKGYLLPKEARQHGLKARQIRITDGTMRRLIADYTRESGVRVLERQLAALCRKAAMRIVSDGVKSVRLTENDLEDYLGAPKYHRPQDALRERIGVVNGLAWTETGGELLEVEVNVMPGTGKVELTGNLGDVMKESAKAAVSYLRSRTDELGLVADFYQTKDIHVHFPEGAVPKDGPSAGIAITTAIASALLERPVRAGLAMTGEVTLRGRVLPIGGLREKTMAALRSGIRRVIIPKDNERDLEDIDPQVRAALRFYPVDGVDQALARALVPASGQPTVRDAACRLEPMRLEPRAGLTQ